MEELPYEPQNESNEFIAKWKLKEPTLSQEYSPKQK